MTQVQYHAKRRKEFKKTFSRRFWDRVKKTRTCWIWQAAHSTSGYGIMGGYPRTRIAPRIAYELIYGNIPKGKFILHKCDNPPCVRPKHLMAGTQSQNIQAAYDRKRLIPKFGENHAQSKITMKIANEIRDQYLTGRFFYKHLANKYNISDTLIGDIVLRKSWNH